MRYRVVLSGSAEVLLQVRACTSEHRTEMRSATGLSANDRTGRIFTTSYITLLLPAMRERCVPTNERTKATCQSHAARPTEAATLTGEDAYLPQLAGMGPVGAWLTGACPAGVCAVVCPAGFTRFGLQSRAM